MSVALLDRSRSFDLSRFSFFDFLPELALLLFRELARGGDVERFGLRLVVGCLGLGGRFDDLSLLRSRSFVELFFFSSRRSCLVSSAPPLFLDEDVAVNAVAVMVEFDSLAASFGVLLDFSFLSRFSLLLFSDDRSFDDFCDGFLLPLPPLLLLLPRIVALLLLLLLSFGSGEFFELNMGEPNKFSNVLVGFGSVDLLLCFLLLLTMPLPLLLPVPMPTPLLRLLLAIVPLLLLDGRGFVVESGCKYVRSSFEWPKKNNRMNDFV